MTPNPWWPGRDPRRLFSVIVSLGLAMAACSLGPASSSPVPPVATVASASSSTTASTETPGSTTAPDAPTATAPAAGGPVTDFPDPQQYQWTQVVTGLAAPVGIANAGDGSGRLFIIEQPGRIRILQGGSLLGTPFLDITDRVGANSSERGLLGLAFDPQYKQNGYFYVNYTDENGNTVIARFKVSGDANVADPGSEKKLLAVQQPFANHNGGSTVFGPDGYLYLGLGDGGSAGDPVGNAQSTNTLLGKILRIDVEHGDPYAIPPDNPFANGGGKPEIWAYGLRNPWRFSFDAASGDLYIGDVGQDTWEEIDYLPAGSAGGTNFGWNQMEGLHPYKGSDSASFTAPVANYSHAEGGCSVTGGYVYRGQALPDWNGVYFYGDYCSGKVWGLLKNGSAWKSAQLFDTGTSISSFGVDEDGEIYLAWYGGGIYKLEKK
jgi:glucose/arabinose dehydrogenase